MTKKFLLLLLCLFLSSYFVFVEAKSYTVNSVPDPKQSGKGYVSDPDKLLSLDTKREINRLLKRLETKTTDQVAIVIVTSIGNSVPKDFAHRLFNRWGVGVRGKNNGLLILMVIDQRRVEFETGYGMESDLPDATCKRIQLDYMVPRFKEGNYDQGLLDGINAVCDILENPQSTYSSAKTDTLQTDTLANKAAMEAPTNKNDNSGNIISFFFFAILWIIVASVAYSQKTKNSSFEDLYNKGLAVNKAKVTVVISKSWWFFLYMIIPLLLIAYFCGTSSDYFLPITYGYILFLLIEKRIRANAWYRKTINEKDYYEKYQSYTQSHKNWFWAAIFFPFPFILYMLYYVSEKTKIRNHPRNCKGCASIMVKLNEQEDNQYLLGSQVLEEQLNSVDYDVWYCNSCSSKTLPLNIENALNAVHTHIIYPAI